ncbi:MAG: vanadium-dependent haloperoxidase [Bacteroidota bacterium]
MKHQTKHLPGLALIQISLILLFATSCQKQYDQLARNVTVTKKDQGHLKQTNTHSSEVVIKWLNVQAEMLKVPLAPGATTQGAERAMAYCGIAAYESVMPGMPAYQSLGGQLTSFPSMPTTEPGKAYHWAASANAALAEMNRQLFPGASDANKANINALEIALHTVYATETDAATLQRSVAFGKEVASRVFAWAASDGSAYNPPYIPTPGFGIWVPTAPTQPAIPYAAQRRELVPGVSQGAVIEPPPPYSTDPGSAFWEMAKDVYDKSLALTPDQLAMALYHRDAPGYPGGGHFVPILSQVLTKAQTTLDKAVLAYAKMGIATYDAIKICLTLKYVVKTVRPVTYINDVMGIAWTTKIPTPNHPEFPSAHAVNSAAIAMMLTDVLGANFEFSINTYDYLGFPERSYTSFKAMSNEMSNSRVFGGIHYQASCDKGIWLGEKVGQNILSKIKFLKD